MKNTLITIICFICWNSYSQGPAIEWQRCLGGSFVDSTIVDSTSISYWTGLDRIQKIRKTSDNGYVIVGSTESKNFDVSANHGNSDIWVVKLNISGVIQWERCYGGSNWDYGSDIQETSDGGYIISGWTNSNNGEALGFHGSPSPWYSSYHKNK